MKYKIGNENKSWKGDEVGINELHQWVYRWRGRPSKCEHCGTTEKRMYHWANKSHEYKRDLDDWIRLCVPCHCKYDMTEERIKNNSLSHIGINKGKPSWCKGLKNIKISGNKHYRWNGGKPKCKMCNKQLISYYATHCKKCRWIDRRIRIKNDC